MSTLVHAPVLEYSKDSTAVILRDDNQPALSFYILEQLRRRNQFCDIELRLKSSIRLQAHRVVLASSSPFFMKLLSKNTNTRSIMLDDSNIDVTTLESMIEFFYTSKLRLTESNVQALCDGARILQMDRIEKACCKFMLKSLKTQNGVQYLKFAKRNKYTSLLKESQVFIAKNIVEVSELPAFCELVTIEDISMILSLDELVLSSEQELVDILLSWMKHDPLVRQTDIYSLLLVIDLPQFNLNNSHYQLLQALYPPSEDVDSLYAKIQQCLNSKTESEMHTYENASRLLFAVGGISTVSTINSVEKFDAHNSGWVPCTDLPRKKAHAALVTVGEKLYSLGGLDGNRRLNNVDIFEPEDETWVKGPSMLSTKSDFGVAHDGDKKIFCIGGYSGSKDVSTVDVLDLQTNTWKEGPSLQQSRSYVQAAIIENTIYAVGGVAGSKRLASVEKLDLSSTRPTWRYAASLNIPRSRPGVAEMDGRIYAVGGYNGVEHLDSVECYCPVTNQWAFIETMSVPRNSPGVACFGNKIVVAGGHSGKKLLDTVESYDPETKQWMMMPAMKTAKCDFALCSLVVIGLGCAGTWM